jgi:protein-S-isoprenylcysteine O-methyltransferase Ste14
MVRHPMYLFSLILFWLFPFITDLILAFFAVSTLYFLIGMIPEEKKLVKIYCEEYERY